jgi:hypothetical protein
MCIRRPEIPRPGKIGRKAARPALRRAPRFLGAPGPAPPALPHARVEGEPRVSPRIARHPPHRAESAPAGCLPCPLWAFGGRFWYQFLGFLGFLGACLVQDVRLVCSPARSHSMGFSPSFKCGHGGPPAPICGNGRRRTTLPKKPRPESRRLLVIRCAHRAPRPCDSGVLARRRADGQTKPACLAVVVGYSARPRGAFGRRAVLVCAPGGLAAFACTLGREGRVTGRAVHANATAAHLSIVAACAPRRRHSTAGARPKYKTLVAHFEAGRTTDRAEYCK